jgi:hypothetical protein
MIHLIFYLIRGTLTRINYIFVVLYIMNNDAICKSFYMQRRQLSRYGTPINRFNLISPYPTYTQNQLDMRRKAEILKYENKTQNTKTNNLTKRQQFSLLVNGKTQNLSQYEIKNNSTINKYADMSTLPTMSTNSDIPGTPFLLRLDPTVPLYNYLTNSTYINAITLKDIKYDLFTINKLSFLTDNEYNDTEDVINQPNIQTRSCPLGVIKFLGNQVNTYTTFNISSPLAFWVNFIYGCGITDINDNIIKNRGEIFNNNITLNIIDVNVSVLYNGNPISIAPQIIKTFNPMVVLGTSVEIGQNYGAQYIGLLEIRNLVVPSYPNSIYDVTIDVTYSCETSIGSFDETIFDFFKTGVFSNIAVDETNFSSGFQFESIPIAYSSGVFIQY